MNERDSLVDALRKIVAPLLDVDRAEIYVVGASASEVRLHLAGTYAGCPGCGFVERSLLAPVVGDVYPKAELIVTSGFTIPKDAEKIVSLAS